MGKPVCVFCGSSPGASPLFASAAQAVGQALAKDDTLLLYGGGRRGIMGVVSQATLDAGGKAHGIVPKALTVRAAEHTNGISGSATPASTSSSSSKPVASAEGAGSDLLKDDYEGRLTMEICGSMHERKLKMAQMSTGGFIVLPGGYGTFEEALEMITWNQLRIHRLPVVILNIADFYSPLRDMFQSASKSGFINPENLSLVSFVDLPGGNSDDSRAGEWGGAAVQALKDFKFSAGAGYNLQWERATKTV